MTTRPTTKCERRICSLPFSEHLENEACPNGKGSFLKHRYPGRASFSLNAAEVVVLSTLTGGSANCALTVARRNAAYASLQAKVRRAEKTCAMIIPPAKPSPTRDAVLVALKQFGEASPKEVIAATRLPAQSVYHALRDLANMGGAERVRAGRYRMPVVAEIRRAS